MTLRNKNFYLLLLLLLLSILSIAVNIFFGCILHIINYFSISNPMIYLKNNILNIIFDGIATIILFISLMFWILLYKNKFEKFLYTYIFILFLGITINLFLNNIIYSEINAVKILVSGLIFITIILTILNHLRLIGLNIETRLKIQTTLANTLLIFTSILFIIKKIVNIHLNNYNLINYILANVFIFVSFISLIISLLYFIKPNIWFPLSSLFLIIVFLALSPINFIILIGTTLILIYTITLKYKNIKFKKSYQTLNI
ncbi:hypothetical protein SLITO_v1c10310 [Spiroplasma litorale]|uniref:Uncharacterized protein n=1 Tax=Spiroplasma litorale TaxID=216942 RepID=A0A0K1W3F8_9MOLU|nr:hypothetical protein SLITO_v1c10310 [Spiroplasma litorale]